MRYNGMHSSMWLQRYDGHKRLANICHVRHFFQAGYFEGMTELEKYKMYKKAQMMLAIKKLKAEEKAVEEMVAEEEVGFNQ